MCTDLSARACMHGCARAFLGNFNLFVVLCKIQRTSPMSEQAPQASHQSVPREFFLYKGGSASHPSGSPGPSVQSSGAPPRGTFTGSRCVQDPTGRVHLEAQNESPGAETSSWQPRQRGAGGGLGAIHGPVREGQDREAAS